MSDHEGAGPDEGLGLDEVLAALRRDLVAAREDSAAGGYGLGVAEVEIEMTVQVSRTRTASGGVGAKWFVLSADAGGEASRETVDAHRVRLTLRPVDDPAGNGRTTFTGVGHSDAAETIGAPIAERDGR